MAIYLILLMCTLNHAAFAGSRVAVALYALPLAAIAFLLGLGLGCGQPVSLSLIYALTPRARTAEAAGVRVVVNNFMHFVIPLLFGSLGTVLGFFPVFLSNSAMLVASGYIMHRNRPPGSGASA
jgi:hypothetical protein